MLAYFFAFRYIMQIYISRKKAICLGSITKSHVTRYGGGLQSRAKQKPHLKTPSCGFFHNGAMVLLEFRFLLVSWEFADHPRRFARGWMEYATPALQVVIVPYQLGSTRELGTV